MTSGCIRAMPEPPTSISFQLKSAYRQLMRFARRPNVSTADIHNWYTYVMPTRLKHRVRCFTGKVSYAGLHLDRVELRFYHAHQIHPTLTDVVELHLTLENPDPGDFMRAMSQCGRVHIITAREYHDAEIHDLNFDEDGIVLVDWRSILPTAQVRFWAEMLHGQVANSRAFSPPFHRGGDNDETVDPA